MRDVHFDLPECAHFNSWAAAGPQGWKRPGNDQGWGRVGRVGGVGSIEAGAAASRRVGWALGWGRGLAGGDGRSDEDEERVPLRGWAWGRGIGCRESMAVRAISVTGLAGGHWARQYFQDRYRAGSMRIYLSHALLHLDNEKFLVCSFSVVDGSAEKFGSFSTLCVTAGILGYLLAVDVPPWIKFHLLFPQNFERNFSK